MNKPAHLQINLHRLNGSVEEVHVTPADVPDYVMDNLAYALLEAVERFYSDPENVRKYEEWEAKQAMAQKKESLPFHKEELATGGSHDSFRTGCHGR